MKKSRIHLGHEVYVSLDDSLYNEGKVELEVADIYNFIHFEDSVFVEAFRNLVGLSTSIRRMYEYENYDIFKLKTYYEMVDYYAIIFSIGLIDVLKQVCTAIEETILMGKLTQTQFDEIIESTFGILDDKQSCESIVLIVYDILNNLELDITHLDIAKTIFYFKHHATQLEFVQDNYEDYDTFVIEDNLGNPIHFCIEDSQFKLWISQNDECIVAPIFNKLVLYYSDGRKQKVNYTDLIAKLRKVDKELFSMIRLGTGAMPLGFERVVLNALNIVHG